MYDSADRDATVSPFDPGGVVDLNCSDSIMTTHRYRVKVTNIMLGVAINEGCVIILSWIDPGNMVRDELEHVNTISFRMAKESLRIIVTAYLYIMLFPDTIVNISSDEPASGIARRTQLEDDTWPRREQASGQSWVEPNTD